MDNFYRTIQRDPSYALALPLSIELHKLSNQYQDYAKPRLFLKTLDVDGFAIGFDINTPYRATHADRIQSAIEQYNAQIENRLDRCISLIDNIDTERQLRSLVFVDRTEQDLYECLTSDLNMNAERVNTLPPMIQRIYDDNGLLNAIRFNNHFGTVQKDTDGTVNLHIYGLENLNITQDKPNIDQFLKSLSGKHKRP